MRLISGAVDVGRFQRRDGELLLAKDVLDRQVIDVRGTRVVRVNDLYLTPRRTAIASSRSIRAAARSCGGCCRAAMRDRFAGRMLTDWRDVEYLMSDTPAVRLKVGHLQLRKLRPQQLARIVSELSKQEGAEVLASLEEEHAADTLEELSTEQQAQLLSAMPVEQAADLIEEMEPDDAADVLAHVPAPRAEELLDEMDRPESEAVRRLLEYDPDTRGRHHDDEHPADRARSARARRRCASTRRGRTRRTSRTTSSSSMSDGVLAGVLSMRQVLIAADGALVRDVMTREPVTVGAGRRAAACRRDHRGV